MFNTAAGVLDAAALGSLSAFDFDVALGCSESGASPTRCLLRRSSCLTPYRCFFFEA